MKKGLLISCILFCLLVISCCEKSPENNDQMTSEPQPSSTKPIATEFTPIIENSLSEMAQDYSELTILLPYANSCYPQDVSSNDLWVAGFCILDEKDVNGGNKQNIFLISLLTGEYVWLLSDQEVDSEILKLQFSPDSQYLAGVKKSGIWLFSAGDWGEKEFFLLPIHDNKFGSVWAPNSESLFFYSDEGNDLLYQFFVSDGQYRSVLQVEDVFQGQEVLKPLDGEAEWGPAFGDDSDRFVFISFDPLSAMNYLCIKNLRTGNIEIIASGKNLEGVPYWLQGRGQILMTRYSDLLLFDYSTMAFIEINRLIQYNNWIIFDNNLSPNKEVLVFRGTNEGDSAIFVYDIESDEVKVIEERRFRIIGWLSDSQHVVVVDREPMLSDEENILRIINVNEFNNP